MPPLGDKGPSLNTPSLSGSPLPCCFLGEGKGAWPPRRPRPRPRRSRGRDPRGDHDHPRRPHGRGSVRPPADRALVPPGTPCRISVPAGPRRTPTAPHSFLRCRPRSRAGPTNTEFCAFLLTAGARSRGLAVCARRLRGARPVRDRSCLRFTQGRGRGRGGGGGWAPRGSGPSPLAGEGRLLCGPAWGPRAEPPFQG